jgi:2-oxoglutarate ferredoxin oxidoreductase subunit delta
LLISESRKTHFVVIDSEKCKACLYCVSVCPREIIGVSQNFNRYGVNYAEIKPDRAYECTGCKSCAIMCPDMAITIYRSRRLDSGDAV